MDPLPLQPRRPMTSSSSRLHDFQPTPQVSVWVSSSETHSERKLDLDLLVSQLKVKLEPITGIPSGWQRLVLLRGDGGEIVGTMDDDGRTLASYGLTNWMAIQVNNADPAAPKAGEFSDASNVQKFELTDEEYSARRDTLQHYLKTNKLGPRYAPAGSPAAAALFCSPLPSHPPPPLRPTSVAPLPVVGQRCEVSASATAPSCVGTVRFVGDVRFGKERGVPWVGVECDEPAGKNDGSVEGERYFSCRAGYGLFVKPDRVTVGDYPEDDLGLDEDEDEEM